MYILSLLEFLEENVLYCFSFQIFIILPSDWLIRLEKILAILDNVGLLGIRIMCPSGATCLSADCCFNELTSSSHSHFLKNYFAEVKIKKLKTITNHFTESILSGQIHQSEAIIKLLNLLA
jgi:hypothetical protein